MAARPSLMALKTFALRGALAGVLAALAMAAVLYLVAEPVIDDAIALEEAAASHSDAGAHEEPLVSRPLQKVGAGLGLAIYGVGLGLAFGVSFASARHLVGGRGDEARSLRFAAVGFVSIVLVPFLKYPANPPAVGDPDTISQRTWQWVAMLVASILAVFIATEVRRVVTARGRSASNALVAGVAAWLVLVVLALVLMPSSPDEVTAPAELIWRFRLRSLAGSATFWAALGAGFAWLSHRAASPAPQRREQVGSGAGGS